MWLLCAGSAHGQIQINAGGGAAAAQSGLPSDYKGKPYGGWAQVVPGRLECAYYDLGGEGVAYHDVDAVNHGSGELNHQPGHCEPGVPEAVCYFREKEGVDISYTKLRADFNAWSGHSQPNYFSPGLRQLYVGWEADGEWTNYTIDVQRPGTYRMSVLYSYAANTVRFDLNKRPATECKLPLDTGSYHIWNKADCGKITFPEAGIQLLTMHYNSGNNLAYFEFAKDPAADATSGAGAAKR